MLKKTLILLLIVVVGVLIWFAFGLWTGIYSIYSIPPSKERPDGVTMIISRDEGEPLFNSVHYTPPEKKPVERRGGMGFEAPIRHKRPVSTRIIVELPYIEWAYRKSLEAGKPE